jgi:hybrid cluster-associated redox disulfide protein
MRIEAAWHHHPSAPSVFARHHLPACDGCAVRFDETLAEACAAYGLDIDAFVKELNALLPKTKL